MENIREEVVDIRSCIAYLMVKWKILLLALLIGALAGGALGYYKQKSAAEPAEVTYEEKLQSLRSALQESDALYVENAYSQYKNYGKQLSNWSSYLKNSALQNMDPANYIKRDLQYIVESDNSDVISSFSVSLLGTKDYERIAQVLGEDITSSNAVELISVMNVSQADNAENVVSTPAVQIDETAQEETAEGVVPSSYRSIMDIMFVAYEENDADAVEKILNETLEERKTELEENGVKVSVELINRTTVANDSLWLLKAQQDALSTMQSIQTIRSSFVKNTVDVLGDKERAYFDYLCKEQTETEQTAVSVQKVSIKKLVVAGALGFFVLAFGVLLLLYIYSDKIRAEEQLIRNYRLPVLLRCRIGKDHKIVDPIRKRGLGILTGADAADPAGSGAGKLAAEIAHRLGGGADKWVFLAYDADRKDAKAVVRTLAENLKENGVYAEAGRPAVSDDAYRALLKADGVVVVETMGESKSIALKDILGICRRNNLPVLGCVTLTDIAKY